MDGGHVSSVDLMTYVLGRIRLFDPKIHAYLSLIPEDELLKQAQACDDARKKHGSGYYGIPISIKDNIAVKGMQLTAGSKILEGLVSPYDATVVDKLKAQHFIILGKVNLDEWAFGSSTENSAYGPTLNPLDPARVPGGSSGGSGASVCYGGAVASLGSDTGGSIRLPAAYCGIYALKPTYGNVSRYGLVAFGSSLDQIGPLTHSIDDLEIMLRAIQGRDGRDETSRTFTYAKTPEKEIKIGIPKNLDVFLEGCDEPVLEGFHAFIKYVRDQKDCSTVELDLEPLRHGLPIYYIVSPSEASSNLSRFDGIRYGKRIEGKDLDEIYRESRGKLMGDEAKLRIMVGTFCLSAGYQDEYYNQATEYRNKLRGWYVQQLKQCHALVIPTAPTVAFKFGEKTHDPISMYKSDIYTVGSNLAGIPTLSAPHYTTKSPLPMGIQFLAPHGYDFALCGIAKRFEDFFEVRPQGGVA